jgi:cell division protease FtsH
VSSNLRTLLFWVVLLLLAGMLFVFVKTSPGKNEKQISLTDFVNEVQDSKVKDVTITGFDAHGTFASGEKYKTKLPPNYPEIYTILHKQNVAVNYEGDSSSSNWTSILLQAVPFVVVIVFWIFMLRQMQSGGNKALSFGKSRARLHSTQQKKVTFKDVAGVEERAAEVPEAGRAHSQGRAVDRTSRNGQDAAGPRHRRRSQCSVLFDFRLGFRGNVRWRRREPRPRPVRAG